MSVKGIALWPCMPALPEEESAVAFGAVSSYFGLAANTYTMNFDVSGVTTPLASPSGDVHGKTQSDLRGLWRHRQLRHRSKWAKIRPLPSSSTTDVEP